MRNGSYEQKKVDSVMAGLPEAKRVLHARGIDPSSRLTLAQAAATTSTPIDELLAVLEFKARRAMRQPQPAKQAEVPAAVPAIDAYEEFEEAGVLV